MSLFLPSKVAPPPCSQGNQAPWGQRRFNDVSAILEGKDSKSFPLLMGFSCFFEKKLKKNGSYRKSSYFCNTKGTYLEWEPRLVRQATH
jgi:hypothetical protein